MIFKPFDLSNPPLKEGNWGKVSATLVSLIEKKRMNRDTNPKIYLRRTMQRNFFSYKRLFSLGFACLIGVEVTFAFFMWGFQPKNSDKKSPQLSSQSMIAFTNFEKTIQEAKEMDQAPFEAVIWKIYPEFVRFVSSQEYTIDPEYLVKGYKEGIISEPLIENFKATLKEAAPKPISHDDFDPNYLNHSGLGPYESDLNASHTLYNLEEKQMQALAPILEELKDPIARCLGAPWSIINVLCWETFPDAKEIGPNEWHTDGLPLAINKIMIYLTGADEHRGTTTLKLDENTFYSPNGPPGTWLLFKISEITHRGIKPKENSRIALEIRVIPTIHFDLRPYSAGWNALYPKSPWYQPLKHPENVP